MRSLDVLTRLAKQAVDRERQVLSAIGAEIADVDAEIETLLRAIERETAAHLDFMTSGATLDAYLRAEKTRVQALRKRRQGLQESYEAQLERVRQERVEHKRYECMAERRAAQAAHEAAVKEQKAVDELVAMRRGPDRER